MQHKLLFSFSLSMILFIYLSLSYMIQFETTHYNYNMNTYIRYTDTQNRGADNTNINIMKDYNATPRIILYWNPVSGFMGSHMLKPPHNCPVNCIYTEDSSLLPNASAVIFHLVVFGEKSSFPPKSQGQYFVGLTMESAEYYSDMNNKKWMENFDLKMTYKLDSDFPMLYISSKADYLTPPRNDKYNDTLASIFISNPGPLNDRNEYAKGLLQLLPCHSYGRYLNNMGNIEVSKKEILPKYKFTLAFENSNTEDYVTEKLFHAFRAGTVPIYMGAPNVDVFCPSNHSIIKVTDFPTIEALADYVKMVAQSEVEYNKYLSWKYEGFSANFKKLLSIVKYDARCRLCMKLHDFPVEKWDRGLVGNHGA